MRSGFGGHALPSENGFKTVMALGAGAALLAFFLASFLPRRQAAAAPAEPAEAAAEPAEISGARP